MKSFLRFIVQLLLGLGLFIIGTTYSDLMIEWGAGWFTLYWLMYVIVNAASLFYIGPPPLYIKFAGRDKR